MSKTSAALSLADVADTQLTGLTGRKSRINRNLAIVSQIPAARELEKGNATIRQQERQQAAQTSLQNEQSDIAKSQANKGAVVQSANTLGTAAYLTKDSWLPAVKGALGITPAATPAPAATAATTDTLLAAQTMPNASIATPAGAIAPPTPALGDAAAVLPVQAATPALGAEIAPLTKAASSIGLSTTPLSNAVPATAGTGLGSTSLASAAGPAAIVAGAEVVKKMAGGRNIGWGGKDNDWDEKTTLQQMTSAPGTSTVVVPFLTSSNPLLLLDQKGFTGKLIKEASNAERLAMKPIDWLFGNK